MEGQKSEIVQNNSNARQWSETSFPSIGNQNVGTNGGWGGSTANTGSSSGLNGAQNSTPLQAKPSTPVPTPSEPCIVDDGRKNPEALPVSMQSPVFGTLLGTGAWAMSHFGSDGENNPYLALGWHSTGVYYSDGTEGYSIWWYQSTWYGKRKYHFFFVNRNSKRIEVRFFNFGDNYMNYYRARYGSQLLAT